MSNMGGSMEEIKRCVGLAKTATACLTRLWQGKGITKTTQDKFVNSPVFSIFIYATETWTVLASD